MKCYLFKKINNRKKEGIERLKKKEIMKNK
jgi:hypothetical protein